MVSIEIKPELARPYPHWPLMLYCKHKFGFPQIDSEGELTIVDPDVYYKPGISNGISMKRQRFHAYRNVKVSPGKTNNVCTANYGFEFLVDHSRH
jgi:hypothetical protein